MTIEEAIEILIAVSVCDRPILSCDFCARYVGTGNGCDEPTDKEIEEAVLLLKGASNDAAISALRQKECVGDVNKSLTLDEISERNAPVFLPIKDFPNGGYWCLCENGYIIPPSGHGFMAKERPNWVFYSQKPEEDDRGERKENENV